MALSLSWRGLFLYQLPYLGHRLAGFGRLARILFESLESVSHVSFCSFEAARLAYSDEGWKMSERHSILVMSTQDEGNDGEAGETDIALKPKEQVKKPPLYKVFLLNDDYTPMDFVVLVLRKFFGKDVGEATKIMFHVHNRGVGLCGVYPYEVAETKVNQVLSLARQYEHPLKCTMEKE